MSRFINPQLKSDSDSEPDLEVEPKSDAELMAKSGFDFDSEYFADFGQDQKIFVLLTLCRPKNVYFADFVQVILLLEARHIFERATF